ncbi:MAG: zinc ribbon domain-containing protein [Gemmatimonadota bacterium]|nr:MAG: zinc ribbon domain-containing protein [Gemmatimonadota bacterium]
MPAYDYVCQDCGETFEIRASMAAYSEGLSPRCQRCGSEHVARSFSAVSFLSGSGGAGRAAACGPSGFS